MKGRWRRAQTKRMGAAAGAGEDGRRGGRGRRRRGDRGVGPPGARQRDRCPHCRRRCPGYDLGRGPAALAGAGSRHDVLLPGGRRAAGECKRARGGRRGGAVGPPRRRVHPLLRGSGRVAGGEHVQDRDRQLMRIAWRTVGWICERVSAESSTAATCSRASSGSGSTRSRSARGRGTSPSSSTTTPAGWCGRPRPRPQDGREVPGSARQRALRADQARVLRHGRLDHRPVAERCPNANVCFDPFHIVKLATDALDEIRREVWNEARRAGNSSSPRSSRAPASRSGRTRAT